METIWKVLKKSWRIRKKDIKNLGINPDKNIDDFNLKEMGFIVDFLGISLFELIENL